jgi:hypothetical protein
MKKIGIFLSLVLSIFVLTGCETKTTTTTTQTPTENCVSLGKSGPNPSLGPNDPNKNKVCCSGLHLEYPKNCTSASDITGECRNMVGCAAMCIACGDGVCDPQYETTCNCPSDCKNTPVITQASGDFVCEDLYKEIDNDIINANYCKVDADCSVLILGAQYVDFGCYHFVNKEVDKNQFYKKMDVYNKKCSQSIDKCSPSPKATCIANTCTYVGK